MAERYSREVAGAVVGGSGRRMAGRLCNVTTDFTLRSPLRSSKFCADSNKLPIQKSIVKY